MSKQKAPQRPATGAPMLPKAERRALGKQAAARRAAARRRKALLRTLTPYAAVLGVVGLIVLAFVVFGGGSGTPQTSPSTSATPAAEVTTPAAVATPDGADPALLTKPIVTAGTGTLSKLVTTTLIEGKGAPIASGQTITVNYVGVHFDTGEQFDSSWEKGQPITFEIDRGNVIKGWDQGLVGVKVGSRVQLDIPSELAYPNPQGGQPAGPLRFVVDILGAS